MCKKTCGMMSLSPKSEIREIGVVCSSALSPEHEKFATFLGRVRSMRRARLDVKRRTGQMPLTFICEVAFNDIKHFCDAFVHMRWNGRTGPHDEV